MAISAFEASVAGTTQVTEPVSIATAASLEQHSVRRQCARRRHRRCFAPATGTTSHRLGAVWAVGVVVVAACEAPGEPQSPFDAGTLPDTGIEDASLPADAPATDAITDAGGLADAAQPDLDAAVPSACSGSALTFEDYATCYYEALCTAFLACDLLSVFADVNDCVDNYDAFTRWARTAKLRQLEASLQGGTVVFDSAAMGRCLETMYSSQCPSALRAEPCEFVFVGTVTAGDLCYHDEECAAPGGKCVVAACDNACCAGTCVDTKSTGEECINDSSCAPGDHCVPQPPGDKKYCRSGSELSPCTDDYFCDSGFWCQDNVCVPDLSIGTVCTRDAQCPSNSFCVGKLLAGGGVCQEVNKPGDACDAYCFGNLYCEISQPGKLGQCKPIPEAGESCALSRRCAGSSLFCDMYSGSFVCERLPTAGEPCLLLGECGPGLFCTTEITNEQPSQCATPLPEGQACARDDHCESYACTGKPGQQICSNWLDCR